ncbi:MAG: hypothetical protein L3J66_13350 [Bacteroidales bacterium]|nr:hypothetical protein [Bacteroidales bacterium]
MSAYQITTAIEREQQSSRKYIAPLSWTGTSANTGGQTRTMMFGPNDATHKKVWTGGVTGGLWYTNNINNTDSLWRTVDDFWSNLAICSIAYDPNNTLAFYVGTGEVETARVTYRESSGLGAGIYKTTDGGSTWNLLASTADFDIAANGRIFVGSMENINGNGGATVLYSDSGLPGSWTIPARTIVAVINTIYGFEANQYNTLVNGNGNDGYFLYFGDGNASGILVDAFGDEMKTG